MSNTSLRTTQTERMDASPTTTRLKEFGNWREKISFGRRKSYYYNIVTKLSQWEKPIEWKHAEKLRVSCSLKNGYNNNKNHKFVIQQTPKKAKTDGKEFGQNLFHNINELFNIFRLLQLQLPSVLIPQYQQLHFNKPFFTIEPSSAPAYFSQRFWPATPPNKVKTPQKLNSSPTMTSSAPKLIQQLCQVEASTNSSICLTNGVFAGSKFTGSPSAKSLPLPPSQWLSPSTINED
ncbi:WW domain-containing protein [Meloidogyne graminicola]|uniref:WW domain-containing protein n=1 Tax=Meloidogyne graminicola TaxID=189291 RepID=A0A8S9ZZR7_9BILA|nr:WW domain-containing protein [Meloidogyne graminicola]